MNPVIKFKLNSPNLTLAMMTLIDSPPEKGGLKLDITDYKVEDSIWSVAFGNQIDLDKFAHACDNFITIKE